MGRIVEAVGNAVGYDRAVGYRCDGSAPIEHRILARIEAQPNGCWIWTAAAISGWGYGILAVDGRTQYAHRLAYEAWVGPIPEGFQVDHLCRIKACVKPSHLEAVTQTENIRRAMSDAFDDRMKISAEHDRDPLFFHKLLSERPGVARKGRLVSGGG